MLNDLSFLSAGREWTPEEEKDRLCLYDLNKELYSNNHMAVLDVLLKVLYPDAETNETVKRVFVNLYRAVSKTWGDLLFSENPSITQADETTTEYLTELIKSNRFWKTSRKVAIDVSRYGNGLYKVRLKDGKAIIEAVTPRIWFPVSSPDNLNEVQHHVIAYTFYENKVQYLKAEIHSIGKIEHRLFIVNKEANKISEEVALNTLERYATLKPIEETNVDDFLLIPVSNSADSECATGEDDYTDINPLISQIELHLSKCGKDLEDQGNLKYGPATAVEEGQIARNSYISMLGGVNQTAPPGVVTWSVQHEAIKFYIEQLMFFFYMLSEISPIMFDPNKSTGNGNLSGVAMQRLMQRMLIKASRLAEEFDDSIRRVFSVAAQLENKALSDYTIAWNDGLTDDIAERVTVAQQAGIQQTMSERTAIAYVQGIEGEALETELAAIGEEKKQKSSLNVSDFFAVDDADDDAEEEKGKKPKE